MRSARSSSSSSLPSFIVAIYVIMLDVSGYSSLGDVYTHTSERILGSAGRRRRGRRLGHHQETSHPRPRRYALTSSVGLSCDEEESDGRSMVGEVDPVVSDGA